LLGADRLDRVPPQQAPCGQLAGPEAEHRRADEDAGQHLPGQGRDGRLGDGEAERHQRRGGDRQPDDTPKPITAKASTRIIRVTCRGVAPIRRSSASSRARSPVAITRLLTAATATKANSTPTMR
jgi:hypothetical protein